MALSKIMSSRAVIVGAAIGVALSLGSLGTAGASTPARPAVAAAPLVTWQNVQNGRYMRARNATAGPHVDATPLAGANPSASQNWFAVFDGVVFFRYPLNESVDAWTFENGVTRLCLQDGNHAGVERAYQEPCRFGNLQQFAEVASGSTYSLITTWGDKVCEHWVGTVDWVYTIGLFYPNWATNKCRWR